MFIPLWLQRLRSTFTRRQTAQARRKTPARVRPRVEALEDRLAPAVFTVNTLADTPAVNLVTGQDSGGNISLRSAIQAANATPGADEINFAVSGTIQLNSVLDPIIHPVTIDGQKQIELNLNNVSATGYGLEITSGGSGSTIRGLIINRSPAPVTSGIWLNQSSNDSIADNFLGTDVSGTQLPGGSPNFTQLTANGLKGIEADGGTGNSISGNVISGWNWGIGLSADSFTTVTGNLIGTDYSGTRALGNYTGIGLGLSSHDDHIDGNLISGNGLGMVFSSGGSTAADGVYSLVVTNNLIGTDVTGSSGTGADGQPMGNRKVGIGIVIGAHDNTITGNTIAFNGWSPPSGWTHGGPGVGVINFRANPYDNRVEGNSIYDNAGLGIDLGGGYPTPGPDGVTQNGFEGHSGPNFFQNFPLLTAAQTSGSSVLVSGTLQSTADTPFTVDVYANDPTTLHSSLQGHYYGEGQYYLGSTTATTDDSGNVTFAAAFSATNVPGFQEGWYISATATDGPGNTSEFGPDVQATTSNALQPALAAGGAVTVQAATTDEVNAVLSAVSQLDPNTSGTLTLNLSGFTKYGSQTVSAPGNLTVVINGNPASQVPTTVDPAVPALVVTSGQVIVTNVSFTESGDAPTILVTGGSLTLRNDVIQESTGFTDAAISVTGGTLDLGTTASPGGNTLNVNGTGRFLEVTNSSQVPALGNSFEVNEAVVTPGPYVVTTTADSGPGSLRDGIMQVHADVSHALYPSPSNPSVDEIDFAITAASDTGGGYNSTTGVATITLGGSELLLSSSVIIAGPGAGLLAVNGNFQSRVFEMAAGTTDTLSGLTIENGTVIGNNGGGGILSTGTLTVTDCTLSGNSSYSAGGGIFSNGTLTVTGCTLSGNSDTDGSGIFNFGTTTVTGCTLSGNSSGSVISSNGTTTITGCILSGNSAVGGVISVPGGAATVSGCTLSGNTGTGIYNDGTLTASGCTLSGNSGIGIYNDGTVSVNGCTLSGNSGTGIYNDGNNGLGQMTVSGCILSGDSGIAIIWNAGINARMTISGCTLSGNSDTGILNSGTGTVSGCTLSGNSAYYGGGIANAGTMTVSGCIVSGNSATFDGGGISNSGTMTVSGCTLSGNTAGNGGGGIENGGTLTVSGCTLAGNFSQSAGGAIENGWIATVSGCTVSGNSAVVSGGGICNFGTLTIENASATALYGVPTFDINSALYGNQAPSGADLENLRSLSIFHSAVATLDNQNPGATTINVAATDTATGLIASVSPGRIVFNVQVLAAMAGAATPKGTVTLYDGNNNVLGTATLDGNAQASFTAPAILGSPPPIHAVYFPVGSFSGSTSAPLIQPLNILTLASSANPSLPNQPVTFTATLGAPSTGPAAPTGNVTFVDRTTGSTLAIVPLSGGSAQWTPSALALGAHTIAAIYSGDAHYITSAASVVQADLYHFSGFLAPLNSALALGLNRTIPIKFQLTDYNGPVSSLSAVTSLQVIDTRGNDVLVGAGKTGLHATANQFVYNWQTKGLAAGTYTVTLVLADGTTYTKTVQLSKSGGSAGLTTDAAGGTGSASGGLLGGNIELYVDNSNGDLTVDEQARIQDAVTAVDAVTEPYGVTVAEVTDPTQANVTLNMDTTSAVGGYTDGVLGCTTDAGQVTIIQGWNLYADSDTTLIGSGQYDFQTVVTHELGHALGLGHSTDSTSVMYATLNTGTVNRSLATADLNIPDSDKTGACGLHAAPSFPAPTGGGSLETVGGLVTGRMARLGSGAPASAAVPPADLRSAVAADSAFYGLGTRDLSLAASLANYPVVVGGNGPLANGAGFLGTLRPSDGPPLTVTARSDIDSGPSANLSRVFADWLSRSTIVSEEAVYLPGEATRPEEPYNADAMDARMRAVAAVDALFTTGRLESEAGHHPAAEEVIQGLAADRAPEAGAAMASGPVDVAAARAVVFALLGASWGALGREPELRKHSRQQVPIIGGAYKRGHSLFGKEGAGNCRTEL